MSQQLSLERMVADWMADEAAGGAPETLVDHVLTATIETRPLPRWLAVLREPSMTAQTRQIVGVPRRQLVLAAALVLLAVALVAGAAAFLLRQPPTTDAWPGFRGDASRSGAAVRGPIGNPTIAWQFHADGSVGTAIAVAGGLVLAASDDGLLHAIDIDTGTERWQLAVAGVVTLDPAQPLLLAIWLLGALMVMMGGRVIPFFTARRLGVTMPSPERLWPACELAAVATALAVTLVPRTWSASGLALIASVTGDDAAGEGVPG